MIGETLRALLSMPHKNEYVVTDGYSRKHTVQAIDADQAVNSVCRKFKVDIKRCSVRKVK